MMTQNIENLTTIRQSILSEMKQKKDRLPILKKAYDDSVLDVDQLTAMGLNLDLTINIMKGREGPTPVNGEITIPEY